jgi:hypothetical protein
MSNAEDYYDEEFSEDSELSEDEEEIEQSVTL